MAHSLRVHSIMEGTYGNKNGSGVTAEKQVPLLRKMRSTGIWLVPSLIPLS